jgi:hypothetical protein
MTKRKQLSEDQAKHAMETRELPGDVVEDAENVAVVLTQGWCPQWTAMKGWLSDYERNGKPSGREIVVYEFVYDQSAVFEDFRRFKESVWNNYQIPYVRYYKNGVLAGESNYVSARRFLSHFE